ncbi:MAG: hypothetical protein ACFE95_17685 [Candidatus Hodarchaeota archaeon]
MENKANENDIEKKSMLEKLKSHLSKTAEEELSDEIPSEEIAASIFLIVVNGLFGLYFIAHQIGSTGFFTSMISFFDMVMLYGILIYWITTSVLILLGQKHPSRDLDTYGGLLFASFAILWLLLVFPFEFTFFADVLPVFLRFLLQWISDEIALVLLVLLFILHLIAAVYSLMIRFYVRKARSQNS